jgi:hypothetical protein
MTGRQQGDEAEAGWVRPRRAWIERADGSVMDLELRPGDTPLEWIAVPPAGAEVVVGEGDHLRLDMLGAGQRVVFDRVWRAPDLRARQRR